MAGDRERQAHDETAYPALMNEVHDDPKQMLADKGYDSDAVRDDITERGGEAMIPTRAVQQLVDKAIYGETASSASSIASRVHAASPPATTS